MAHHQIIKNQLKKNGVFFLSHLPSQNYIYQKLLGHKKGQCHPLIICDRKLTSVGKVSPWLKNELVYFVAGGEKLKSVQHLSKSMSHILQKVGKKNISGFVSMGGGSVGDFTGFLASVYKRGRPVVHIPTTWLSAVDSAHGGKTALNAGQVKNVLGSYLFPKAVFIIKELLPPPDGVPAEMLKMAFIKGGVFYKQLLKLFEDSGADFSNLSKQKKPLLWPLLPQAIYAKIQITKKDPYEQKNQRIVLNLGHTLAHVLELYFGLSHDKAVLYGLCFALRWSHRRFGFSNKFLKEMSFFWDKGTEKKLKALLKKLPPRTLQCLVEQDKKKRGEKLMDFVFIKRPGQVFAEKVLIQDLLMELRQLSRGF